MIYEMRTYTLKPGMVSAFEAAWAPMLDKRMELSPLAAFWHTEFGPLNQVIHVWPYESMDERTRIRAEAAKRGIWPPPTADMAVKMESEILLPAPFMKPMTPRRLGNIYEMRTYTFLPGAMPEVLRRWGEKIEDRERFSPLAACWYAELGGLNRFIHVWPYESFAQRDEARVAAAAGGNWPANTRDLLVSMENKLLIPASFSPLR